MRKQIQRTCWCYCSMRAMLFHMKSKTFPFKITRLKSKEKLCRYVSRENYVCRIKFVPKVVRVLIPIKFIYFCELSWYLILSSRSLGKVGVKYLKFKYWLHIFKFFLLTTNFLIPFFLSHNYYCPYYYISLKVLYIFLHTLLFYYFIISRVYILSFMHLLLLELEDLLKNHLWSTVLDVHKWRMHSTRPSLMIMYESKTLAKYKA